MYVRNANKYVVASGDSFSKMHNGGRWLTGTSTNSYGILNKIKTEEYLPTKTVGFTIYIPIEYCRLNI